MATRANSIQLRAPAKINLSFRILERRADGFHEIETLMTPVSLFDEVTITETGAEGEIVFTCDDSGLPTGEENLVVRAARLFQTKTQKRSGLVIDLRKNIPHGAGLGGGSSDAASVLLGLNQMFGGSLDVQALAKVAGEIGSDVPFFIYQSAAVCRGRGELVEPINLAQPLPLLLLKPAFGVPTPWAYGRWKDSRELPTIPSGPQEFAGFTFQNDLERPVFEKYLFLARAKVWLLAQPEVGAAMMSGSGSTIFAVLSDGADGEALANRAKGELDAELWTHLCETL